MKKDNIQYFEPYPEKEYPDLKPIFEKEIFIAFAVCGCGNKEFIVDGQTQVCEKCHKQMFRTEIRRYKVAEDK